MARFFLVCLSLFAIQVAPASAQQAKSAKQLEAELEPLTKTDLKPTFDAVVECAQRNQDAGCQAARILADKLLDKPFLTALCKDTAFTITIKAKVAAINNFDRKELLLNKATDLLQLCVKKEQEKPTAPAETGPGIKKR
jgi:hypothetical protein